MSTRNGRRQAENVGKNVFGFDVEINSRNPRKRPTPKTFGSQKTNLTLTP